MHYKENPIAPWLDSILAPHDSDRQYRFVVVAGEMLFIGKNQQSCQEVWERRDYLFEQEFCKDLTCWIATNQNGWAIAPAYSTIGSVDERSLESIYALLDEMTAIEVLALMEVFFDPFKELTKAEAGTDYIGQLSKELALQAHRLPDRPASPYSVVTIGGWMSFLPKEHIPTVLTAITSAGYLISLGGSVNPKFQAYANASGQSTSEILYLMKMQLQGVKR